MSTYLRQVKKIAQTIFNPIAPSELVLNADGSVYHLAIRPEQIADTLIVVGDPGRVKRISRHFDHIEHEVENREFVTHTGTIGNTRISVLSTGIGVDNIDIVMNELDALRNIDLNTRQPLSQSNPLRIVRLGTSGALNADLAPGSVVHSKYAIGLDGVVHFYNAPFESDELALAKAFAAHTSWNIDGLQPYAVRSDNDLGALFGEGFYQGITVTACGFYGPQGRILRLPLSMPGLNERMGDFNFNGLPLANYEMESSALFGLGAMLGHACTTVCVVVANRIRNEFLSDHHPAVDQLITRVLERLTHH
jgi:uridine phosphorylase